MYSRFIGNEIVVRFCHWKKAYPRNIGAGLTDGEVAHGRFGKRVGSDCRRINYDRIKRCTLGENALSDICDCGTNRETRQPGAVGKRLVTNALNCFRNRKIGDELVTDERLRLDGLDGLAIQLWWNIKPARHLFGNTPSGQG